MPSIFRRPRGRLFLLLAIGAWLSACGSQTPTNAPKTSASYDRLSGRLEELKADTDGDGKNDAVAHMDGTRLKSIDVDRNGDGKPDRWEYYDAGTAGETTPGSNPFDRWAVIVRVEESNRPDGQVTRREFYEHGVLARVEDDTNFDGHPDKWEYYDKGVLTHVDLDLSNKGIPDRRLVYQADGSVSRIDVDPDGDGVFTPEPAEPPAKAGR